MSCLTIGWQVVSAFWHTEQIIMNFIVSNKNDNKLTSSHNYGWSNVINIDDHIFK